MNDLQHEIQRLRIDVDQKLEEKPSRYEVRFLILLAIVANQVLPTVDVARAAGGFVVGLFGW